MIIIKIMNKSLFTIWSGCRQKKCIIIMDAEDPQLYENLILKASIKLEVDGSILVLESNGTPVEVDVLPFMKSEVLLLLERHEKWHHTGQFAPENFNASSSTITLEPSIISSTPSSSRYSAVGDSEPVVSNEHDKENIEIGYVVDCNTEYMWSTFQVPWNKVSTSYMELLDRGKADRRALISLVHLVVDEMRNIKKSIPTKAFKIVAKKIIDRYPEVFRDQDEDGVVLGDGTHSLVCKLQDRHNYLNRPHKRPSLIGEKNPVDTKRQCLSAKAGCLNWAPNVSVTEANLIGRAKVAKESDADFYEILQSTYSEQRTFLNSPEPPRIQQIKQEWPIIFSEKAIYWHFNQLTNSDIHLLDTLAGKLNKIEKMTKKEKRGSTAEELDNVNSLEEKAIRYIASYFNEDVTSFLFKYKDQSDIEATNLPMTPSVIETADGSVFHVYVERESISSDGYNTFLEALKVAFALYFILNIQYPKGFTVTLELLQRMLLKIHPDAGSKSKKVNPVKKKVFNFINKFVKLED